MHDAHAAGTEVETEAGGPPVSSAGPHALDAPDTPDTPTGPGGRPTRRLRRSGPAMLAAALAFLAYCAGIAAARVYPFGKTPRSINDLWNQFLPVHAQYQALLQGHAAGDLLFNWDSGFGVGFLADFSSYLTNPFSLVVGLFPRSLLDFAVFLITPLSMAAAAAAMTVYLRRIGRGPWWAATMLAVGYALAGWALDDASFVPMWLWGPVALPLLCLAGEWCLARQRWTFAVCVITVAWFGNFYTASMATFGAGIILLLRAATTGRTGREALRGLGRAGAALGVGIGLNLPFILTSFKATKAAEPDAVATFHPYSLRLVLTQLLPDASAGSTLPKFFIGTLGLLLALSFPFARAIPGRTRALWCGVGVLLVLSFQFGPTQLAWSGFAQPHGGQYREAWVFSGFLVLLAWQAVCAKPSGRALAGGAGLLAVVALVGLTNPQVGLRTWVALAIGVLGSVLGYLLLRRGGGTRHIATLGALVLVGTVVVEAGFSTEAVQVVRARFTWAEPHPTWNKQVAGSVSSIAAADDFPVYRTEPGNARYTGNDPLLLNAQGAEYYSSYFPADLTSTLGGLGFGWRSGGRWSTAIDNPVTDAIFSIGARVDPVTPTGSAMTTVRASVPPLVTVHQAPQPAGAATNAFERQEQLLGATVYTLPTVHVGGAVTGSGPWTTSAATGTVTITARCTPGQSVYYYTPDVTGDVSGQGATGYTWGGADTWSGPMLPLGTVPADGMVTATLALHSTGAIPVNPIGCLDQAALANAVSALKSAGAGGVAVSGNGIRAEISGPAAVAGSGSAGTTSGYAVISTVGTTGWSCTLNGRAAATSDYYGLLSVPLNGQVGALACDYTPPGLHLGLLGAGAALLVLVVVTAWAWYRRRRGAAGGPTAA
jgi:uncharacterized membrane protein YfhO